MPFLIYFSVLHNICIVTCLEREKIKQELDEEYKSILDKNQKEMEEMKKTFEERLKEQGAVSFMMFCQFIYFLKWKKNSILVDTSI